MVKQSIARVCVLVFAALLGGCGATSQFNGFVKATDADAKTVHEGGYSDAAMAQIAIAQNPDFNKGKISPKALKKIQEYSISCQRQIDSQLAGPGQSGASGALNYGVAGTGTGPAADLAFTGAKAGEYAVYGGLAYVLPGGVNGLYSGGYAMASAKGTCTRDFWEDIAKTDPDFKGTHVEVVHAGKAWGNSRPPALSNPVVAPRQ